MCLTFTRNNLTNPPGNYSRINCSYKKINTRIGTYSIRQIAPSFFKGFNWYRGTGSFLIAEPEKALVDSLYLSACKKNQYGYFPELHFPKSFSFKKSKEWARKIPDAKISSYVLHKLNSIFIEK